MRSGGLRLIVLGLLAGAGAYLIARQRRALPVDPARLTFVVTAHQLGVVGYRDPVGAISPDGRWVAYSEGRALRVRPVDGGATVEFPFAEGQIRYLTWQGDSTRVLVEGGGAVRRWWVYDLTTRARTPWREDVESILGTLPGGERRSVKINDLRQVAIAADGRVAAVVNANDGSELWTYGPGAELATVRRVPRVAFPAWGPRPEPACLIGARLSISCDEHALVDTSPGLDLTGPPALSPDGARAYVSSANDSGTLDLWEIDLHSNRATRLTSFTRDTYQPTVTATGAVMFKVQSYRTHVADAPEGGGPVRTLATFQSETPSWDPNGRAIAVTFGSWRRAVDDARYPDIAQDVGIIDLGGTLPAATPAQVVAASPSEDQSMAWSPDRRWIALHSHREMSDDLWLRPADGSAHDRRITFLGRGAETGWPRWSSDGRSILFTSASKSTGRAVPYVVEIDPGTGEVATAAAEVPVTGLDGEADHAAWLPNGRDMVLILVRPNGRQAIAVGSRTGGPVRVVHEFASEHGFPGLGVSPDGRDVAFVAPAPDGFFQVFRMPLAGGPVTAVTTDPSNKTQPAWSPDEARIAFTVWSYDATFLMRPAAWLVRDGAAPR